jgi:hypothetical protein
MLNVPMWVYTKECGRHCKLLTICQNILFLYITIADFYNNQFCATQDVGLKYRQEIYKLKNHID